MNKVNVLVKPSINFDLCNQVDFPKVNEFLKGVSPLYPNFSAWLNFTFRRNMKSNERQVLTATFNDQIIGLSLLKMNEQESKVCTFYVSPEFRDMKVGDRLMNLSLETIDSQNTIISVSDERNTELSPLLKSKGFKLYSSVNSLYREGKSEHFYSL